MSTNRIVEIIRRANLVAKEDFDKAVEFSTRDNVPFLYFLLKNGMADEAAMMTALEKALQAKAINLEERDIPQRYLDAVPREIALQYRIIPYDGAANNLLCAIGDPTNLELTDKLSARIGFKVRLNLASEMQIQRALEKYYVNKFEDRKTTKSAGQQENSDSYVVNFIDRLLKEAAQRKVSDIHIEPFENLIRIRLRSDGTLIEYADRPRLDLKDAITSRVKIISGLDIAEKRLPQDGCTKLDIAGLGKLDFRVSTMPTVWGEKIVMRLLDKSNLQLDMTKLGFETEQITLFKAAIMKPFGMVLVTGPTGSGKTTTLYSALNELNRVSDCVVTAEDPVEYTIPGINQVHVRPEIDLTFAKALKAFLRQDPDVIMVGEIRDHETAEIAMKAALTGHIVLSTLHTNNAPETIERLRNLGIESFTIISAVNAVIAQRLVRKICNNCRMEDTSVTEEELLKHGLPEKYLGKFPIYKGEGCALCNNTGYKGRAAIYEVLYLNEAIKKAIANDMGSLDLKKIAMANGMQTLRQSAWKKVARGLTSVDELLDASSSDFDTLNALKRSA